MSMTFAAIGILGLAALALVSRQRNRVTVALSTLSRPTSPVDEAERVLARRYARGVITADEYRRMMAILRT